MALYACLAWLEWFLGTNGCTGVLTIDVQCPDCAERDTKTPSKYESRRLQVVMAELDMFSISFAQ